MLPSLSSVLCHLLQVPHQPPRPRFSSPSRSSSALNLALSQAASNAYANAHLAAGTHQCLGAAPLMDPSQSQGLRPLEDPCRSVFRRKRRNERMNEREFFHFFFLFCLLFFFSSSNSLLYSSAAGLREPELKAARVVTSTLPTRVTLSTTPHSWKSS